MATTITKTASTSVNRADPELVDAIPSLVDVSNAAKALADAGAQQVLWHPPIPGGEHNFDPLCEILPIGFVVIVDDLIYSERYYRERDFAAIARVATGEKFVEVHVTDVLEWAHRSQKVVTSFEAWAASNSIRLHSSDPIEVHQPEEIGMAYLSKQEARELLPNLRNALVVTRRLIETLPEVGQPGHDLSVRWAQSLAGVAQANMAIELGLKILGHLSDRGHVQEVHDFAELLNVIPWSYSQEAEEILIPLRWRNDRFINWRVLSSYGDERLKFRDEFALVNDEYLTLNATAAANISLLATDSAGKQLQTKARLQIEEVISQALDLRSQLKTSL